MRRPHVTRPAVRDRRIPGKENPGAFRSGVFRFNSQVKRLIVPSGNDSLGDANGMVGMIWRCAAAAGLVLAVAGCAGLGGGEDSYNIAGSSLAVQPYPTDYRGDLLAFMRTYINDLRGVREAMVADPVERDVGGKRRYVACVRYTATGSGDAGGGERAAIYRDGRFERLIEKAKARELCAGASYAPFPEMEKLTR